MNSSCTISRSLLICDSRLLIISLKDCSASGNQKRREPPRGEADKAPMPTSLRQQFSSSLRVRYSMRNLLITVIHGFDFIYNLGTFKVIGQPGFYLCDCVCLSMILAPRACSILGGLSLGMRYRATEGLGLHDQLTSGWHITRRGRHDTASI